MAVNDAVDDFLGDSQVLEDAGAVGIHCEIWYGVEVDEVTLPMVPWPVGGAGGTGGGVVLWALRWG